MGVKKKAPRKRAPARARVTKQTKIDEESEYGDLFEHEGEGYVLLDQVSDVVAIRQHRDCRTDYIVTKAFYRPEREAGYKPTEIRTLELLAPCNRIVPLLAWYENVPEPGFSTAIYPYSIAGDLDQWRKSESVKKSHRPIPESFIWRFLFQMSQALAFMHGELGSYLPRDTPNDIVIHKDIKPKNILVFYPPSSTYPSFKLHDFGLAALWYPDDANDMDRIGTYEWQPPENPFINTPQADVWSLGACVHYLCLGRAPIEDVLEAQRRIRQARGGSDPEEAQEYDSPNRYYAAVANRIVTHINYEKEEQEQWLGAPFTRPDLPEYNPVYSDALEVCMKRLLTMDPDTRPTGKKLVDLVEHLGRERLKKLGGKAALVDLDLVVDGQIVEIED